MSDTAPEAPMQAPTIEETRYINAGIYAPPRDPKADSYELSFMVGPAKMISLVLSPEAADNVSEALSGSEIEIVPAAALPPNPS